MTDPAQAPILLQAEGLCKSYGDVPVVEDVSLTLRAGEVRAILGENGAGKSTLVKMLAGFEQPDAGYLRLAAAADGFRGWKPMQAEAAGVLLVHQELNLADQLTVTENVFLGREIRQGWRLDKARMAQRTCEYLASLQCRLAPDTRVGELPVATRQLIEIARAIAGNESRQIRVLIMDEPTAVLTSKESEALYELIARLRAGGTVIVFISHKLEEIERIADRITILRDGRLVGDFRAGELSQQQLAGRMVGREISTLFPVKQPPAANAATALEVTGLTVQGTDTPCSFVLQQGEILGFAGLVGCGRTALLETVIGLRPAASGGTIKVNGRSRCIRSLAHARALGMVYLTKDRKGSGLLLEQGLVFNFSLLALSRFARLLVDTGKEALAFAQAADRFEIRTGNQAIAAGSLSGGNQQKLLLAKILAAEPRIIIIDEPTRGIDIGTKTRIYHFIHQLAATGHAIVMISSDMLEVIGLSHRVAVMYHGQLAGLLQGDDINEEEIMAYATGLKRQTPVDQQATGGGNA